MVRILDGSLTAAVDKNLKSLENRGFFILACIQFLNIQLENDKCLKVFVFLSISNNRIYKYEGGCIVPKVIICYPQPQEPVPITLSHEELTTLLSCNRVSKAGTDDVFEITDKEFDPNTKDVTIWCTPIRTLRDELKEIVLTDEVSRIINDE